MTNFEFYSTNLEALSKRIRRIKSDCEDSGNDFDTELKAFLGAEYKDDTKQDVREIIVVNVGFVYHMHDTTLTKELAEIFTKEMLIPVRECKNLPEMPDDVTLTGTQVFEFTEG